MGLLKRHELSFEADDPRPGAHSAKRRVREVLEMLASEDQARRAGAMDVLGRADETWAAFFE
jgi:hypothetical protein